ncbi:hypothetical protein [Streptomyces sp. NPDC127098]|uniref:hypothetical protein n=1 Tax=Streptomyces sp. NPDC127098 TaxID=3347137 RepID=UPI0036658BCE
MLAVTSFDAFTGRNFRRGGFLAREQRYVRAGEFLAVTRRLWDSWPADAIFSPTTGSTRPRSSTATSRPGPPASADRRAP